MQKRPLGNTGLSVSILGFGASPLGSVFGPQIDEEEGVAAVHEAIALGVNYIDCSPFYGATKAETVLGRALKDIPRDKFILSTKVGRYGDSTFDFSAARVAASVAESMARLNVSYIDIILCHDVEFVDLEQIVTETLPALAELKKAGKIGFVGFSGLPLKIFRTILDRAPPGAADVVLSYCHYTLLDQSLEGLLPYLREKGVAVVNASPLAMGLFTAQGPPAWHPAPAGVQRACAEAVRHCAGAGVDPAGLAIKFALRNPEIPTTLVGMCTREQVRRNVAWAAEAARGSGPAEGAEGAAEARVGELLAAVKGATWVSGRPENN